jgi:hypothetical protein
LGSSSLRWFRRMTIHPSGAEEKQDKSDAEKGDERAMG